MCKISIIMPVFNKRNYIERSIQSIQKQSFHEWELIIIDDGSTDGSAQICDSYGNDQRIQIIHTENGGVSRARNRGLQLAIGEYITFVDADDYVESDFLEKLYVPNQEMIIGGLKKVNAQGNPLELVIPHLDGIQNVSVVAKKFYSEQKETGIYGYVAGKLAKRSVIEKNEIQFDEHIKLAEDYDFYLKMYSCVEHICFQKHAGYCYEQETENSTVALDDEKIDFFTQIEIQLHTRAFLERKNAFGAKEYQLFLSRVTGYVYTILLMQTYQSYKDFLRLYHRLKKLVPEVNLDLKGLQRVCIKLYSNQHTRSLYWILRLRTLVRK